VKEEKELGIICVKVVVQRKGGDKSTVRGSVHDKKQGTENGALGTPQEEVYKDKQLTRFQMT